MLVQRECGHLQQHPSNLGRRIVELTCSSTEDAESDESVEYLRLLTMCFLVTVRNGKALLEAIADLSDICPSEASCASSEN